MPQNNLNLQLGSLEFEDIKSSIIEHLQGQDAVSDYMYEGSVAQVLLDILAYNTLYYGYYSNMIASEMFLDSAQLESSMISLVKPLGYVIPGKTSAKSQVKIRTGGANTEVPKYTKFTGTSPSGTSYSFYTLESNTLDSDGENTLIVTEAKNLIQNQPLSIDQSVQKGYIFGLDIDITTISVEVYNETTGVFEEWSEVNNIQDGLDNNSKVYWLERSELGFFVSFGGGLDASYGEIGLPITPNQSVRISYFKSSGANANNVGNFLLRNFSNSSAISETITISSNGSDKPNLEAIRFFAPKWFASQDRAVTLDDCRGILAQAGFVSDDGDPYSRFNVWGGESMDPPMYGRLFVSLNETEEHNPIAAAQAISLLENKTCVSIIPEFMNFDPNEVFVEGRLIYEPLKSNLSENQLLTRSTDKIKEMFPQKFNLQNIDVSIIVQELNNIDAGLSVSENDISLKLIKNISVSSDGSIKTISFNNKCLSGSLYTDWFSPSDVAKSNLGFDSSTPINQKVALKSEGDVDKDGYQSIIVWYSVGATNVEWVVGKWHVATGLVNISKDITSDSTLRLKVSSDYSGSEKFFMKYNMFVDRVSYDLSIEQRN